MSFDKAEDMIFYEGYQHRYGGPSRRLALEIALAKAPASVDSILVVGCGFGSDLVYLTQRRPKARIVATESSVLMLRSARNLVAGVGGRVALLHADADQIPREIGTFALIISHGSIRRWRDPGAGLAHVHRFMMPGGLIYISDICGDLPADLVNELADGMKDERDRDFFRHQVATGLTRTILREILSQNNICNYKLAVGGLGGYSKTSAQARELMEKHAPIWSLLSELFHRGGYGHPRSSEAVFHLYIADRAGC